MGGPGPTFVQIPILSLFTLCYIFLSDISVLEISEETASKRLAESLLTKTLGLNASSPS